MPMLLPPRRRAFGRLTLLLLCALTLVALLRAGPVDLGNGFIDHGVASPISHSRGTVVTVDAKGRDVVLSWLFDHRGGYALLAVDCASGHSEQYPMPFDPNGDTPYASLLSSRNKYYTLFNAHFVEFDPVKRTFTFTGATMPRMAMAMTEDDRGVVWAVTYPQSGLVAFDPATRQLTDYGSAYEQSWPRYTRSLAADDAGWIYFGLGNAQSQIVMFDPATRKAVPVFSDDERRPGTTAHLYRDADGKVYGQAARGEKEPWYEFHAGKFRRLDRPAPGQPKALIAGDQSLFYNRLSNGGQLTALNLVDRRLTVTDTSGAERHIGFDYTSEGAAIVGVATAPNATACGGTMFPMRFFSFEPKAGAWTNHPAYGQFNTVTRQGSRFYFGGYMHGFLLEWDPALPWVDTKKGSAGNPQFLTDCGNTINRPHRLLAHPDGKSLILAGTPGYGLTGGGLLFWDRETRSRTLLTHKELIPEHSTVSLVALGNGRLLGGTTTAPGTGGVKKAATAELYVLDLATKRVEWHQALIAGVQEYSDLAPAPNGLVYGVADGKTFFVFDPTARKVVHTRDLTGPFGRTTGEQCPRIFVSTPLGILMLMERAVARVVPGSFEIEPLAVSPVPITAGGDYLAGRVYFASGSRLVSYTLQP